jgi:hypothetical protein
MIPDLVAACLQEFPLPSLRHDCDAVSDNHTLLLHNVFHSSGSLETRLRNGGVGNPPHHNTMLSISYLIFSNLMCRSDTILSCLLY